MSLRGPLPIPDLDHIVASMRPALIDFARGELRERGSPDQDAEDLVQQALLSWLELVSVQKRAEAYIRKAIRNRVADRGRERRDAMTHHPLSIDRFPEQIEEL